LWVVIGLLMIVPITVTYIDVMYALLQLATWQEWLVSRGAWVDVHPCHTSLTLGGVHMAVVVANEAVGQR
jgi:hypothetical protein